MSVKENIIRHLSHLPPTLQLRELEKLSMEIRKANGLKIENERIQFSRKYPKIKEESIDYKR